ncbi:CRISPR-associated helicase Cas3' [Thermoflavimicrobium daqui]|uniref:CRISPR-associated helicase/endonuclease Cas3 n=1 Tax=Thermoflavimicrobium daqui TaxID=2137476 RepID=A0A364K7I9_9BACL|nr:CRISPR-associated helicase Cas3' [Thermoflavimicrobium daqui]RAL26192.1 CRISPR-associated helicase/endonuclease Cas3 [Thermoflavimicrobium daqui]
MDMIYAKSDPMETLQEHTDRLLENLSLLKETYPQVFLGTMDDRFEELLEIAVRYHDAGKVNPYFQNLIRKQLGLRLLEVNTLQNIPHNYLSVLFLPIKKLQHEQGFSKQQLKALIQAVAYHHERDQKIPKASEIRGLIQILQSYRSLVEQELDIETNPKFEEKNLKRAQNRLEVEDEHYLLYVLLKGVLHRLDHAASAWEKVEYHADKSIEDTTYHYIRRRLGKDLRDLQKFTYGHQDHHLVIIAQTGMGKTEAGLLWLGKDKGFFTLPVRVSINELYRRVTEKMAFVDEEGNPIAGLLHSNALSYLNSMAENAESDEQQLEYSEQIFKQSQLLSKKLTFTTIDQILTFPLLFRGYEKWYATMSYAKVIIDEIQAYSPRIMAILLKALEMIHQVGGKFLIMTATMPHFFLESLEKRLVLKNQYIKRVFTENTKRHKLSIKESSIFEAIPRLLEQSKNNRVLVICNTVKRSCELYRKLQETGANIRLLHSAFTAEDRAQLERAIIDFAPNQQDRESKAGIWITTQLIEASIDVDFDELHTELSTLDSLFQRMGRCYRNRELDREESNIWIYTDEVSGIGSVYDQDIIRLSKEALEDYNESILDEDTKVNLVDQIYRTEVLADTNYYREFKSALEMLDTLQPYELNRSQAQKIVREIDSVQAIPRIIYDQMDNLFTEYEQLLIDEKEARKKRDWQLLKELRIKRRQLREKIERKTVHILYQKVNKKGDLSPLPTRFKGLEHLFILNRHYEFDTDQLSGRGVVEKEESESTEELFI